MGNEMQPCSGVVVTFDQMAAIISEDNREHACRALLRHTAMLLQSLKDDLQADEFEDYERRKIQREAGLLTTFCKNLSVGSSVDEIRSMLKNLTTVYEDNSSGIIYSEQAINIWGILIKELYPEAPAPTYRDFFSSDPYPFLALEQEEFLFVFSEDECFERTKTEAGLALDKMLEETTELLRWAD